MRSGFIRFLWLAAAAGALTLAGCGGGGRGGSDGGAPTADATLSGVAATGAPFAGATVSVYDRAGTLLATTTVGADGGYSLTIPSSAQAPLVLEATREDQTLVSTFAETRTTRLNITPLTNLIAARLAPQGNPLNLRGNVDAMTPASLQAKVDEIIAILKPLLDVVGDSADPLTGVFTADGTGHDKVLDALQVDIRLTADSSNIEITVRAATAEPIRTSFASNDASPPPLPSGEITAAALPPDNIAGMLADFIARQNACYALAPAQRASAATGDGSAVAAAECRTLFLNDDPTTYLSNGARVGSSGAFSSLFSTPAGGLVSDAPQLEFLRDNPEHDIVFTFRWTASGNVGYDQQVVRNVGGTLKAVGNQYAYNARVRPFMQEREFVNQPEADSFSTGYNVAIVNRLDSGSNPVFSKVLVTAPNGSVFTYKPNGGRSQLVIERSDGSLTGTPVVRLAGKFKNGTAGSPAVETNIFFMSPMYTDEQLRAIPEQGVWKLEFFHADTSVANVVQHYRTTSRAPTLAELAVTSFASLTDTAKAELRAGTGTTSAVIFGAPSAANPNVADLSTEGDKDFWTVPAGAVTPTFVTVLGRGPDPDGSGPLGRVAYDDGVGVPPSARKTLITCSPLGASDNHCDSSTGVLQYAEDTTITSLELWGNTQRWVEASKVVNMFRLSLP